MTQAQFLLLKHTIKANLIINLEDASHQPRVRTITSLLSLQLQRIDRHTLIHYRKAFTVLVKMKFDSNKRP
jgi:hypothetical protein